MNVVFVLLTSAATVGNPPPPAVPAPVVVSTAEACPNGDCATGGTSTAPETSAASKVGLFTKLKGKFTLKSASHEPAPAPCEDCEPAAPKTTFLSKIRGKFHKSTSTEVEGGSATTETPVTSAPVYSTSISSTPTQVGPPIVIPPGTTVPVPPREEVAPPREVPKKMPEKIGQMPSLITPVSSAAPATKPVIEYSTPKNPF